MQHSRILFAAALCVTAAIQIQAQTTPVAMQIELANIVGYMEDTTDLTKFATATAATPSQSIRNFAFQEHIADIVAVNGKPVKGTLIRNARLSTLRTAPTPGQGIADVIRTGVTTDDFEFLNDDGSLIGNFAGSGPFQAGTSAAPGIFSVTGGSQAFLGMRGQYAPAPIPGVATLRPASVAEDPANRRANGGGRLIMNFLLLPDSRPQIVTTSTGAVAVVHSSDFTLVTATSPAKAGETLSLFAKGLGPVKATLNPGQPFPASPLAAVNSPIEVSVGGSDAEILGAVGYPGTTDSYQVNFRVPPSAAHGAASLQVTAAWIPGAPVSIQIQ
jgi:uncharacterized protein (TIGR03437 family)